MSEEPLTGLEKGDWSASADAEAGLEFSRDPSVEIGLESFIAGFHDLRKDYDGASLSAAQTQYFLNQFYSLNVGDFPGAYEYLLSAASDGTIRACGKSLARKFMAEDTEQALAWLQSLGGAPIHRPAYSSAGSWLAESGMSVAEIETMFSSRGAIEFGAMVEGYLSQSGRVSMGDSFRLLESPSLSGDNWFRAAKMALHSAAGEHGYPAATKAFSESLATSPDKKQKADALEVGFRFWATDSPTEAANYFAGEFPEELQSGKVLGALISAWSIHDPGSAAKWLSENSGLAGYDHGAITLAMELLPNSPFEAMAWAGSIKDGENKARMQKEVLSYWNEIDREAARDAWENLPDTQRNALGRIFN